MKTKVQRGTAFKAWRRRSTVYAVAQALGVSQTTVERLRAGKEVPSGIRALMLALDQAVPLGWETEKIPEDFESRAELLYRFREGHGLMAKYWAQLLGHHINTIYNWEGGQRDVRCPRHIFRLTQVLTFLDGYPEALDSVLTAMGWEYPKVEGTKFKQWCGRRSDMDVADQLGVGWCFVVRWQLASPPVAVWKLMSILDAFHPTRYEWIKDIRIWGHEMSPGGVLGGRCLIGLTQMKFAEVMGVSIDVVRGWEANPGRPHHYPYGYVCRILQTAYRVQNRPEDLKTVVNILCDKSKNSA